MEFTFASVRMRKAAIDKDYAYEMLGNDLGNMFLSLIADMREAMFIGGLPDSPEILDGPNGIKVRFRLQHDVHLETEALLDRDISNKNWTMAHRIRLMKVYKNGNVLI